MADEKIKKNSQFNDLTAVQFLSGKNVWQCKCKCGKWIEVNAEDLLSNKIRSCGCNVQKFKKFRPFLQYEVDVNSLPQLLVNQQLGNLILLKKNPIRNTWTCKCLVCRKKCEISEALLLTKTITSCGCNDSIIENTETEISSDSNN